MNARYTPRGIQPNDSFQRGTDGINHPSAQGLAYEDGERLAAAGGGGPMLGSHSVGLHTRMNVMVEEATQRGVSESKADKIRVEVISTILENQHAGGGASCAMAVRQRLKAMDAVVVLNTLTLLDELMRTCPFFWRWIANDKFFRRLWRFVDPGYKTGVSNIFKTTAPLTVLRDNAVRDRVLLLWRAWAETLQKMFAGKYEPAAAFIVERYNTKRAKCRFPDVPDSPISWICQPSQSSQAAQSRTVASKQMSIAELETTVDLFASMLDNAASTREIRTSETIAELAHRCHDMQQDLDTLTGGVAENELNRAVAVGEKLSVTLRDFNNILDGKIPPHLANDTRQHSHSEQEPRYAYNSNSDDGQSYDDDEEYPEPHFYEQRSPPPPPPPHHDQRRRSNSESPRRKKHSSKSRKSESSGKSSSKKKSSSLGRKEKKTPREDDVTHGQPYPMFVQQQGYANVDNPIPQMTAMSMYGVPIQQPGYPTYPGVAQQPPGMPPALLDGGFVPAIMPAIPPSQHALPQTVDQSAYLTVNPANTASFSTAPSQYSTVSSVQTLPSSPGNALLAYQTNASTLSNQSQNQGQVVQFQGATPHSFQQPQMVQYQQRQQPGQNQLSTGDYATTNWPVMQAPYQSVNMGQQLPQPVTATPLMHGPGGAYASFSTSYYHTQHVPPPPPTELPSGEIPSTTPVNIEPPPNTAISPPPVPQLSTLTETALVQTPPRPAMADATSSAPHEPPSSDPSLAPPVPSEQPVPKLETNPFA